MVLFYFKSASEQDRQISEIEARHEETKHESVDERNEMIARFTAQIEELHDEISNIQHDRDEQLLMAENDKQKVIFNCCTRFIILT